MLPSSISSPTHGHPDHSLCLNGLANAMSTRFRQLGRMEDLSHVSVKHSLFSLMAIPIVHFFSTYRGYPSDFIIIRRPKICLHAYCGTLRWGKLRASPDPPLNSNCYPSDLILNLVDESQTLSSSSTVSKGKVT